MGRMKFPKRKKRGPVSAHFLATTPIGLSPALSAVRSIVDRIATADYIAGRPRLRHKRKSENLYLESVCDADLTEIDPVTGNWVAIRFGRTRSLSAPMIIVTPPSPSKSGTVARAGRTLAKVTAVESLPRSMSLGDITWLATAVSRVLAHVYRYWQTPTNSDDSLERMPLFGERDPHDDV